MEDAVISLERWRGLWQRLGSRADTESLFDEVVAAYRSRSHRAYHDLEHLEDCLAQFDAYAALATAADEVELALWFHDAVYAPPRRRQ